VALRPRAERGGWQGEPRDDLTLGEVRHALAERWVVVVVCGLVAFGGFMIFSAFREPSFTAEATVEIRPQDGAAPAGSLDETVSALFSDSSLTGDLGERAARAAGWQGSTEAFEDGLKRSPVETSGPTGETGQMRVRFTASSPEMAVRVANAYAAAFVERLDELEGRLAGGTVPLRGEVVEEAELPTGGRLADLALGAATATGCGLLVGGVSALFLEGRARRWSGSRDAELTLRVPVLGVIPDLLEETGELEPAVAPPDDAASDGPPGSALDGAGRRT
jgi:capsular polysaccharide biosynthesis protein